MRSRTSRRTTFTRGSTASPQARGRRKALEPAPVAVHHGLREVGVGLRPKPRDALAVEGALPVLVVPDDVSGGDPVAALQRAREAERRGELAGVAHHLRVAL